MFLNRLLLLTLLSLISLQSFSQPFPAPAYPADYFRNPLNIPINLAANFGELRNNHFHMGLDIRTNQRENLPVHAAAEGYISRIKIEQYGFGRAIYITHPNGYTTLYAHLNDFYKALNDYVISVQYETKSWEQDLYLPPNMFTVTKGQFIANSGNTGGSAGPHLHFEIRETYTENNLNPFLFGLPVTDRIPPFINRLYMYNRQQGIYENNPRPLAIRKVGSNYFTRDAVITTSWPKFSFGITAEDKSNLSFNFGIYQAELYVDDQLVNAFRMNDFSYPQSRYINGSVDYATHAKGGPWVQLLSQLPGNKTPIFSEMAGDGVIELNDTELHSVHVVLKDAMGNDTHLSFKIKYNPAANGGRFGIQNYIVVKPNEPATIDFQDVQAFFSNNSFYDTVHFVTSSKPSTDARAVSPLVSLHNYTVPVHDSFTVNLKPVKPIAPELNDKVVMQMVSNKKREAVKADANNGWYGARFRELGNFELLIDTVAPTIVASGWVNGGSVRGRSSISFLAKDETTELAHFTAELDGEWLMFSRKNDYFIHKFDDRTSKGKHTLVVTAEDEAGNTTTKTFTFTR